MKKKYNALEVNRIRCILAIVFCTLLCFMELIAISSQLLIAPDELVKEVGWKSYHMFTILANLLMGVVSAMCIPFAVDGIRYHNYHLPRWYVDLMYTGTFCVALTFTIAVTVLSPAAGFYRMMIFSNNILFHTICPLMSIVLFTFINTDHRIRFRSSVIAITPVILYMLLYLVMVFVIGEENGGWRDHYQVQRIMEYLPMPVIMILMVVICLVLSNILRVVHNSIHERSKAAVERYYQEADAFSYPDIRSAIKALADMDRSRDMGGELTVPRRIMRMMDNKYKSGLSAGDMCEIYVREYYRTEEGTKVNER